MLTKLPVRFSLPQHQSLKISRILDLISPFLKDGMLKQWYRNSYINLHWIKYIAVSLIPSIILAFL